MSMSWFLNSLILDNEIKLGITIIISRKIRRLPVKHLFFEVENITVALDLI